MSGSVAVVGGLVAGLALAAKLSAAGLKVTLVETPDDGLPESNRSERTGIAPFPLVVAGADASTLAFLSWVGTGDQVRFKGNSGYEFYAPNRPVARLRHPPVPRSIRTVVALATLPLLSIQDRRRMLAFLERNWEQVDMAAPDLDLQTGDAWLAQIGQSESARRMVWGPLCRFLLRDDLRLVSARMLTSALARCFLTDLRSARIAIPSLDCSALFLEPARRMAHQHGVTIHRAMTIRHARFDARRLVEITTDDGFLLRADDFVFALPHRHLTALLPERILSRYAYFHQIGGLEDTSAITVEVHVAESLRTPRLMLLGDHLFHWLVARPSQPKTDRHARISLVAIGSTTPRNHPDPVLIQSATDLIAKAFDLRTPVKILSVSVTRTAHAGLSVRPGTSIHRPIHQSPFPNLFLAGGWTDTDLPDGLESTLRSVEACVRSILEKHGASSGSPSH